MERSIYYHVAYLETKVEKNAASLKCLNFTMEWPRDWRQNHDIHKAIVIIHPQLPKKECLIGNTSTDLVCSMCHLLHHKANKRIRPPSFKVASILSRI